jgi:hypothetical protein
MVIKIESWSVWTVKIQQISTENRQENSYDLYVVYTGKKL